jgi:hypothetical protein
MNCYKSVGIPSLFRIFAFALSMVSEGSASRVISSLPVPSERSPCHYADAGPNSGLILSGYCNLTRCIHPPLPCQHRQVTMMGVHSLSSILSFTFLTASEGYTSKVTISLSGYSKDLLALYGCSMKQKVKYVYKTKHVTVTQCDILSVQTGLKNGRLPNHETVQKYV